MPFKMGAYGHSRLRQRIFGGVTRSMLEETRLPPREGMDEMEAGFHIGLLRTDQIERAYVVINAAIPDLSYDAWRAVVDDPVHRREFVVATDTQGYVRGLCLARVEDHPVAGRILDVPIFIVTSLLNEGEIAGALFNVFRRRAIDARCSHLRFWTLTPDNWDRLSDDTFRNRWDHGLIYRIAQAIPGHANGGI
jgi:hypothetical protein